MATTMSSAFSSTPDETLTGLRVAFVGKLAGMSKRDAQQLVRAHGGQWVDKIETGVDLIVLAEQIPPPSLNDVLNDEARAALEAGQLVALNETQFWQRLGLIEHDAHVSRMYTPAMLAELLGIPVAMVRRWHRRGLLVAQRQVGHLPYFDFAQVATARQLAALAAAGVSQRQIEKQFAALRRWFPGIEDQATPAPLVVQGKRLLVRQQDGLVEAGGQQRFDFDDRDSATAAEAIDAAPAESPVADVPLAAPADMVEAAQSLEENGQLELAAEMYRSALAAGGPHPETCFQLADVLYRLGDSSAARERYYMAVELDENYVEARVNLGCILAEGGQYDLAASAFEGALAFHDEFPDAHYHLARTLDDLGRPEQAVEHWSRFLELAPDSPWAATARQRLST